MAEPLTWDAILAMDEPTLNLAIEFYVHKTSWLPCNKSEHQQQQWSKNRQLTYEQPPQHATTWDRTMALALSQRISMSVTNVPGTWIVWAEGLKDGPPLYGTSEAEIRHAICRLALYRAVQTQEVAHG